MSEYLKRNASYVPPEQQAIRNKCFHPSGTFVEFPLEDVGTSIPARFEKIVRLYPDRLAVKMADHALTYEELNRAANRIAWAIIDKRGPQLEPIVVLLEQGVSAVAAILGVLKAGKFYVPVDRLLPKALIQTILNDFDSSLLVTNNRNLAQAHEATKSVLNIDEVDAKDPDENLNLPLSPDDLASVVYTSGSTGKPKGVVQNQRNVLRRTLGHSNSMHICPEDRLSFISSHCTAGGTFIMCSALLSGAALFPFDFRVDGVKLPRWLIEDRLTVYQSGPAVFRRWTDGLTGTERFPELRLIRLSGMPVSTEDVRRYRRHFSPDCLLVNVFGTSEAEGCHYFIDKLSKQTESSIPVGYPIGESNVFVLDSSGRPAQAGEPGEIVFQSSYLARGYWQNPALTQERFLSDPTGGEEGLYVTGDLGRISVNGCLHHLGRKDSKVKIRGNSVEISEIENLLHKHPGLNDAVVVCAADSEGESQLIAYVVSNTPTAPTASALRHFLLETLPQFMVPTTFVALSALPLMPGGKVDRKALPAPPPVRPNLDAPYMAPRTDLERKMTAIWSQVLGVDPIGMHDNFFDLGGHSLLATQLVSRLRAVFNVEIALRTLFEAPTIARLVLAITERQAANHKKTARKHSSRSGVLCKPPKRTKLSVLKD